MSTTTLELQEPVCLDWPDWLNEQDDGSVVEAVPELSNDRKRKRDHTHESSDEEEEDDDHNPLNDLDLVEVTFEDPVDDAVPPFNKKQRFVSDDFTLASLQPAADDQDFRWILDLTSSA
ncbi:hypothetical protein DM01DRAFT_1334046 [Hesseltinella vesiculosa]|uniref:Uncharacterized protein n=1 Tax=Hesseltinella vesiculosa TaxID=101127 RepID=A0A1X2GMP1_9FUNG|nr:hypothetical protein DM01DRAFT_1334046 [Hesseltinella vesiculosa]